MGYFHGVLSLISSSFKNGVIHETQFTTRLGVTLINVGVGILDLTPSPVVSNTYTLKALLLIAAHAISARVKCQFLIKSKPYRHAPMPKPCVASFNWNLTPIIPFWTSALQFSLSVAGESRSRSWSLWHIGLACAWTGANCRFRVSQRPIGMFPFDLRFPLGTDRFVSLLQSIGVQVQTLHANPRRLPGNPASSAIGHVMLKS